MNELQEKKETACWIAHQLFDRKMGPGTTGNLSFLHEGKLWITAGGTCFGKLTPEDFTGVDLTDGSYEGNKPSKELELHRIAYNTQPDAAAVIHVHSTYAVLWSLIAKKEADCVPDYTPYLKMTLGTVGMIPYAKPGSEELFDAFRKRAGLTDGWILRNHGTIVTGTTLMKAFASAEELEEACRIACMVQDKSIPEIRR